MLSLFPSWMNNTLVENKETLYVKPEVNSGQHQMINEQLNTAHEVPEYSSGPHLSYIVVRRLRVSSEALGCTCPELSTRTFWNSSRRAWESCCTERDLSLASQKLGRSRTCWTRELSIKSTVESEWRKNWVLFSDGNKRLQIKQMSSRVQLGLLIATISFKGN